jgi:hypothetical protein
MQEGSTTYLRLKPSVCAIASLIQEPAVMKEWKVDQ